MKVQMLRVSLMVNMSNTITMAKRMQDVGYTTGIIGKWGLGAPHTQSIPNEMGFDFFYGYNCQRQAHTYYPLFLYKNRNRVHLANDTVAPNTKLPKDADPRDPKNYAPFTLNQYSPDLMFRELTNFVRLHAATGDQAHSSCLQPRISGGRSRFWLRL